MRPEPLRPFILSIFFAFLALVLASPVHAASLTLAWDPPTDKDTVGYIIRYGTESGKYSGSIDVGLVTSRRIDELTDGKTYFFAVQAYNSTRDRSGLSAEVSGVVGERGNPRGGGPNSVVAAFKAGGFIDIAWLPAAGTPEGYRVEVGIVSGHTAYSAYTTDAAATFDITNLPAAAYFVRVRTVAGGAYSAPSEEATVIATDPPPSRAPTDTGACLAAPGAPRRLRGAVNNSDVRLMWQPGGGPLTTYVLEVGSTPGARDLVLLALGRVTELHAIAGPGTYAVRMSAVNECGWSLWGSELLVAIGTTPEAPGALSQQVSGHLVGLSWAPPASGAPVTRYLIEAATPSGPFAYDTDTPATSFWNADTPSGTYVVTVRAGNTAGFGPRSAPVTVVVP